MMRGNDDFKDVIDWNVYKKQQTVPDSYKNTGEYNQEEYSDVPLGQKSSNQIDTFLGRMPRNMPEFKYGSPENKDLTKEMINTMVGAPGMQLAGKGIAMAKPFVEKGASKVMDYMIPGREAEKFRSTLGQGTSKENIEEMSKRAQFAKKSAQKTALYPQEQLYSQAGKSDVYAIDEKKLPEGNLDRLAGMVDPGGQFNKNQIDALSKALKDYRKTGSIDSFLEKSEDIFNIPELNEKAAEKIENVLSMPTKRTSHYFSDKDVTSPYSKKGEIIGLHNAYETNPMMNNYKDLRSAIAKEMREVKPRASTSDVASERYNQLKINIKNLDKDSNQFTRTLPQNLQNLDKEFRQKYTEYAKTYEKQKEKDLSPSLTLRRLSKGQHDLVDDNAIVKLFSHPTAADQKAILDMGEGAARNAIYAALRHIPHGDSEGMAKTILDLKQTKGFDNIITPQMESWANNMIKQTKRAALIKKSMGVVGGGVAGGLMGGPLGAVVGASLPWTKEAAKMLASKFKK
jgi:hypothetical protein